MKKVKQKITLENKYLDSYIAQGKYYPLYILRQNLQWHPYKCVLRL